MAGINVNEQARKTDEQRSHLLDRERRRLRMMQILFAAFSIILILWLLLSMILNA